MSDLKPSFEELRAKCLKEGKLFEDPDFPAVDKSIYPTQPVSKHITWKRPGELYDKKPQFISDGATRFDLDQGSLGNCWFIAAAATLATKPQLLAKVVPMDQNFTDNYAGIFRFNFWRFGEWKEVVIDDRLPAKYGKNLEFCRNNENPNEFWSALLEKAYAKLNGSYEALLGGNIQDALVDLTGGVSEIIDLTSDKDEHLYSRMEKLDAANTLMGCCISIWGMSASAPYDKGLLSGHAYSISGLTTITIGDKKIHLIRLLNPWGKAEWKGAWSDSSSEWAEIPDDTKTKIQLRVLEDGEFWMSFDEWRSTFTHLQLCHLPTSCSKEAKLEWLEQSSHGSWVRGVNAGGSGNSPDEQFYWNNPQYCIILSESDASHAHAHAHNPLIVSLMQKEKRELNESSGSSSNNIIIGFRLFRITRNVPISLDNTIFPRETVVLEKGIYEKFREVAHHYDDVTTGIYCVIPTTYKPNEEAAFFLRVLTHQKAMLIDSSKIQEFKDKLSGFSQSRSMAGISIAANLNSDNLKGISEPCIMPVRVQNLGQSVTWGGSSPAAVDEVDVGGGGDPTFDDLTPAERDVLEVYETHATRRHSPGVDFSLLRLILTSLNDIGQLGGYRINFNETDCKILFNLVSSWRERRHLTFEQIRKIVVMIKQWIRVFSLHDRDYTEFIPFNELWKVLSSLGFELDDRTKEAVTISYAANGDGLFVTDFINCVAKIQASNAYWKTKTQEKFCNISLQELMETVLLT